MAQTQVPAEARRRLSEAGERLAETVMGRASVDWLPRPIPPEIDLSRMLRAAEPIHYWCSASYMHSYVLARYALEQGDETMAALMCAASIAADPERSPCYSLVAKLLHDRGLPLAHSAVLQAGERNAPRPQRAAEAEPDDAEQPEGASEKPTAEGTVEVSYPPRWDVAEVAWDEFTDLLALPLAMAAQCSFPALVDDYLEGYEAAAAFLAYRRTVEPVPDALREDVERKVRDLSSEARQPLIGGLVAALWAGDAPPKVECDPVPLWHRVVLWADRCFSSRRRRPVGCR